MHSVFVHCVNVTRTEVGDWVGGRSVKGLREHWYVPNRTDPVFSVRFPHEGSEYASDENRRHVKETIGRDPDITLQLDPSGMRLPAGMPLRFEPYFEIEVFP